MSRAVRILTESCLSSCRAAIKPAAASTTTATGVPWVIASLHRMCRDGQGGVVAGRAICRVDSLLVGRSTAVTVQTQADARARLAPAVPDFELFGRVGVLPGTARKLMLIRFQALMAAT